MQRTWAVCLFIGLASADSSVPAHAATTYATCMAHAATGAATAACESEGRKDVERRLDETYKASITSLPNDQADRLRESQRVWIASRRLDCAVFHGNDVGSMASVVAADCMIGHTEQRIENLKAFLTR